MEGFVRWWVNNPVAANLLMVGILLSGYLGFITMEREAFPSTEVQQVTITVPWPAAAPQEVEEQIIKRIEDQLENVDNIERVTSTATEGSASITVATYPDVDINGFLSDVENAVDSIPSFPRDIENPRVERNNFNGEMMRLGLYGDLRERELFRLAETLKDELSALPYIATINISGLRKEEVSIELSEQAMRSYGLTFAEVAAAIRNDSVNTSSGEVRTPTGDVQLRARNLADTQTDFEEIVIRQAPSGATIRVGDVANVVDGFEDDRIITLLNGKRAVVLEILSPATMQVVKASDGVKAWMEKRQQTLPDGIGMQLWFDTADIYKGRMDIISAASYQGLLLVFLILILTLRPRVALWVTAGIGVAFLGTFSLLPANDISLNVMSTFAFLLVLGIVVDDAIVVGESVHHHTHLMGGGPEGAVQGAMAVARPVFFAVLTTMVAFAPWWFVSGEQAQWTKQLSVVITVALTISLIEAFLILPAHLRHLRERPQLSGLARKQQVLEHGIMNFADMRFRPVLNWCIRNRYVTVAVFFGGFVIAFGLLSAGWVKFSFFPKVDSTQITTRVILPTGTPLQRAIEVRDQLTRTKDEFVRQWEIEQGEAVDGETELVRGWYTRTSRNYVNSSLKLSAPEGRDVSSEQVANRFREILGDIPDADEIEVSFTIASGRGGADARWLLRHPEGEVLRQASRDLQGKLRTYDGTFYVRDSQRGESDEIIMDIKPGAEKLGLTLGEVSRQVRQAYYGEEVQRLPREFGDVKVMVRYPRETREQLNSLDDFRVRTPSEQEVPLLSVVDVELASGVQRIQRRDGQRILTVAADIDNAVMSDILRDVRAEFIPALKQTYPGLDVLKAGQQEEEEEFFGEIQALYTVAFFIMYALIAVAFKSYWLPLLIMTAIPFGFMGAVFGHMIWGIPMALFSYFGIGAAAGVVVNDNLVLVDYIRRLREQGQDELQSIVQAGVVRFRPILLTTVTTFVGLMPILLERSTSAEFLKPSVVSLSFGVLFALFVTLLMVPALYAVGDDCRHGVARLWGWISARSTPSARQLAERASE
ncbi:MAG: efflux RND transporter permease subunit [Pseudomonadota bacterium]